METDNTDRDVVKGPDLSWPSIRHYLATRVSTLKPPSFKEKGSELNIFRTLRLLNAKQWHFLHVAFWGWTWDAFDFFSVSLTATEIAAEFDRPVSDITWGITLVLMLRSVGAVLFGVAGDRWGRKWPFIVCLILFIVLELATGFCQTYQEFLGVRAIYGIAMGGMIGIATATALEDCPAPARGLVSGILMEGYSFGYLLCVIFTRALPYATGNWRTLYWFGACPPVLIILYRYFLPETDAYLNRRVMERDRADKKGTREFMRQAKLSIKAYWHLFIYLVFLMTGMNFMSHGSQDLYPTFLKAQRGFSPDAATVSSSVANIGGLVGGIIIGHISNFAGRRLTIIVSSIIGGALVYPWAFSTTNAGINAAVFFQQFTVGCWGVIPIHISELSPPRFRSLVVGLAYQLGNLASSAASTIEATMGEKFPLYDDNGKHIEGAYDYGRVMAILTGAVYAYVVVIVFIGPENKDVDLMYDDAEMVGLESFTSETAHEKQEEKRISHVEEREQTV